MHLLTNINKVMNGHTIGNSDVAISAQPNHH
jgi:hypothetical protein